MTIKYRTTYLPTMAINVYSRNRDIKPLYLEFPTPIFTVDNLLKVIESIFESTDGYNRADIMDVNTGEIYLEVER